MSTRSMIAVMHGNKAKAVYCHWDGYLAHNGAILNKYYDSVKANKLVAMGDLSSLGMDIGEQHDFGRTPVYVEDEEIQVSMSPDCTFYGRDRGEEGTEFKTFQSLSEMLSHAQGSWCEYAYILKGNEWFYTKRSTIEDANAEDGYIVEWTPLEFLSAALKTKEAV